MTSKTGSYSHTTHKIPTQYYPWSERKGQSRPFLQLFLTNGVLSYSTDQTVGPRLKIKVNSSHFLLSGTCFDRSDPSNKPSLTPTTLQSEETRTTGRANTITSWPGHWWHPLLFRGEKVCTLTYLGCKTSCSSGSEWRCDKLLMSHLIPVCCKGLAGARWHQSTSAVTHIPRSHAHLSNRGNLCPERDFQVLHNSNGGLCCHLHTAK